MMAPDCPQEEHVRLGNEVIAICDEADGGGKAGGLRLAAAR